MTNREAFRKAAAVRTLTAAEAGGLLIAACAAAIALIWISPWLLLPIAGALIAHASAHLPEPLRDPVKRLGRLTFYSTLPVGIVGLALAVGKGVLPSRDFLWLMLRTYDLHQWMDDQVWLKPVVLAPLLGAAGILSIVIGRPGIIARFGQLAGVTGQAALSLYVLSLFSLVAPGPFELKLDEATSEMRGRLQASLQLQRTAENEYLAKKAVMVLLEDQAAVVRSHLVDIVGDAEIILQRLGCARRETRTAACWMAPDVRAAFEQSLPPLGAPVVPTHRSAPAEPHGLPSLAQAVVDADAATEMLRRKNEAAQETIEAMIGNLSDFLPLDEIAKSVVSELLAAIADRYGNAVADWSLELTGRATSALDELGLGRLAADVAGGIARAAATLHDTVVRRGPWVLVWGLDATQNELDLTEGLVKDIESRMPRGSTVNAELAKRIRERGRTEGTVGGPIEILLDRLKASERLK